MRSNLNLYAQQKESEVVKLKKEDSESAEGIKSKKRASKDWRGVMRDPDEPPPLRSAVIANIHEDDNTLQKRSSSPPPPLVQRKRGRSGDRAQNQIDDERSQLKVCELTTFQCTSILSSFIFIASICFLPR